MKKFRLRRPSAGTVIASIALFVSLGGVSYGVATGSIDGREIKNSSVKSVDVRNNTLRTDDIRNNEVRGRDIRNSTIRGQEVALDSLGARDIKESTLTTVPDADRLDGLNSTAFQRAGKTVPFSVKLQVGESQILAANGAVFVEAKCVTGPTVRILAGAASTTAVMAGEDLHDGGVMQGYLTPTTPDMQRRLSSKTSATTEVSQAQDGFVAGPDGKALHFSGEAGLLGLDYAGGDCYAAGLITPTG